MTHKPIISLDGMGGDYAPDSVVNGAALALRHRSDIRFRIYGDRDRLQPLLDRHQEIQQAVTLVHTEVAVEMDEPPAQALRRGRGSSSMWCAIEAVKAGEADAALSAGNTGALMAMGKVILKTAPGVTRPVLAAFWPNMEGIGVVLDLGATISQDARQLVESAVMGEAYARLSLNKNQPAVGLLNVGVEGIKGTEAVKEAARVLNRNARALNLNFHGFIEGDDIARGTVEVVVTDGFTGNIALKTAEGTARQLAEHLKNAMKRSIMSRIGYFFARGAFRHMYATLNPGSFNGAAMLGLNGVVVKSHGSADAASYSSAILAAVTMVEADLAEKIKQGIRRLDWVVHDDAVYARDGMYGKERKLAIS